MVWLPEHAPAARRRHAGGHRHLRRRARAASTRHLADLDRLWDLDPDRILPNHGDPDIIAAGGYAKGLIRATQDYIRVLQRCRDEPALRDAAAGELVADSVDAGWIDYFAPYEAVHRENVEAVTASMP